MSFQPDTSSRPRRTYQAPVALRILIALLLVVASFAIPYALFGAYADSVAVSSEGEVLDDPGKSNTSGEVPAVLTFDTDSTVSSSATISLATPFESGWVVSSQDDSGVTYSYTALACSVTAEVQDITTTSVGKDASVAMLKTALGSKLANDPSLDPDVVEVSYNIVSTAQMVGTAYTRTDRFLWTGARAITPIKKGIVITADCPSEDAIYEVSDSLRSQFGLLLKP